MTVRLCERVYVCVTNLGSLLPLVYRKSKAAMMSDSDSLVACEAAANQQLSSKSVSNLASGNYAFCDSILAFCFLMCRTEVVMYSGFSHTSINNKKDGYCQQNVRQRQKLISIIDYDVCILEFGL